MIILRLTALSAALILLAAAPPARAEVEARGRIAAPEWPEGPRRIVRARAGEPVHVALRALQEDGEPLDYTVSGLPRAAIFQVRAGPHGSASLDWSPGEEDVGVHDVLVVARAGGAQSAQTVTVSVEDDWTAYFVPGAHFSTFLPNDSDRWGAFVGVSIEFEAAAWIHRNEQPGPSHGRLHLNLDVLASTRAEVSTSLHVSGGVDLTFESNPARRFLLPLYGLEAGLMFNRQQLATLAQITPMAGLHLWAERGLFATATAGYLMPLNDQEFDALRGVRGRLGIAGAFW